jgi:hypothetical protein
MTPASILAAIQAPVNDTTLTHEPNCTRPDPWRDRFKTGWVRLKCPECLHVANVAAVAQAQPITPKPAPTSNYRCRIHHDIEVSWKGTNCTRCAADLKRRKAPKRDDEELWT